MGENIDQLIASLNNFVTTIQNANLQARQPPGDPVPPVTAKDILQKQALNFSPFSEEDETFESYIQRLENYFRLKGLTGATPEDDTAKVQLLIHCIGPKYYQLLTDLSSPDLPSSKKYADLLKLLQDSVVPKINTLTEQHKFFSCNQESGTTISSYVAKLKKFAKSAEFKSQCQQDACSKDFFFNYVTSAIC